MGELCSLTMGETIAHTLVTSWVFSVRMVER